MNYVARSEWLTDYRLPGTIHLPTRELWTHHGAAGSPTLATLRSYHRHHRRLGWAMIGYSWAITGDGTIYECRGWGRAGAHTLGRNTISHAVLLVGNWTSGRVPDAMVASLAEVAREGYRVGALSRPDLSGGHREAPNQATSCPGSAGMDAVRRARRLLTFQEDDLTPEQDKMLREVHAALDGRNVGLDLRAIRLALRGVLAALGIRTRHVPPGAYDV